MPTSNIASASPFPTARPVGEGSTLAVVAPSGPFQRDWFEEGLAILRTRYEVVFDEGIFSRTGYFAGADARRLAELQAAIRDPRADAIICARGGYGATRLLPDLDPAEVAEANKLLVGFSDATALHALWARAGVRSIHGPMVASLAGADKDTAGEWFRALEGRAGPKTWPVEMLAEGTAEGRLFGGNLAVLGSLIGTPHAPPLEGGILFLEDVGERPYRIDRLLTSLDQAGWLQCCAGFLIGAFADCEPGEDGVSAATVLRDRFGGLGVPVATGFPAGHLAANEPMTFGALARIEEGRVTFPGG